MYTYIHLRLVVGEMSSLSNFIHFSLQQFCYNCFFFRTKNHPSLGFSYGILLLNEYLTIQKKSELSLLFILWYGQIYSERTPPTFLESTFFVLLCITCVGFFFLCKSWTLHAKACLVKSGPSHMISRPILSDYMTWSSSIVLLKISMCSEDSNC